MKNTASTSKFAPYISDGRSEEWGHYHVLIEQLDALEQEIARVSDRELQAYELERSGFHEVARLRKQDPHTMPEELFQTTLQRLEHVGFAEVVRLANEVRLMQKRSQPASSAQAKRELLSKLERLAQSSNSPEALNAQARADELKEKYVISSSDPFDFALDELFAPVVLSPKAKLQQALDNAWLKVKPLGDQYYDSERVIAQLNGRREELLAQLETHPVKQQVHGGPVVTRRRVWVQTLDQKGRDGREIRHL